MTLSLILTALIFTSVVRANSPSLPVDDPPDSPLMITAYSNSGQTNPDTHELLATRPSYVEIYNNSSSLVALEGWILKVSSSHAEVDIQLGNQGYITPKGFTVVSFNQSIPNANLEVTWTDLGPGFYIASYKLAKTGYQSYEAEIDKPEVVALKQRLRTTSTGYTSTGNYDDDQRPSLFQNPLYLPPVSFALRPVEILPNTKRCGPTASDLTCGDYVKFYNHTDQVVDFNNLRLRIGYKGQNASISNAIELSGTLEPGKYLVFNSRNDGQELNLTNTGGFVWLEDKYGLKTYENTVVEYPSASSSSRVGASWAYNSSLSKWDWAVPNPDGENKFATTSNEKTAKQDSGLKPCNANQYRNPETNRCRLIAAASSQLKPCQPGQTRNPQTNRCRSTASASTLKPCRSDQFRNPETGRCKLLATSTSQLKPCRPDQYRNPETNRCRKKPADTSAVQGFAIEETPPSQQNYLSWWIAIGIGLAVVARIIWEWRAEIAQGFSRLWVFKS